MGFLILLAVCGIWLVWFVVVVTVVYLLRPKRRPFNVIVIFFGWIISGGIALAALRIGFGEKADSWMFVFSGFAGYPAFAVGGSAILVSIVARFQNDAAGPTRIQELAYSFAVGCCLCLLVLGPVFFTYNAEIAKFLGIRLFHIP